MPPPYQVDMSPDAVRGRLRQASEMLRLCLALGRAERPAHDAENTPPE